MFCPKCGHVGFNNQTPCQGCGFTEEMHLSSPNDVFLTKKSRLIPILMISFGCVLVFSLLAILAFRNLDKLISSKNYYLFVEYLNSDLTPKKVSENYAELIKESEEFFTKHQQSKQLDLSFQADLQGASPETKKEFAPIFDLLNQVSLALKYKLDFSKQENRFDTKILFKNTEIATLQLFKKDNMVFLNAPLLYPKTLVADLNKKEELRRLGIDTSLLQNNSLSPQEIIKAIALDKETVYAIMERFQNFYIDNIPADAVKIEKDMQWDDLDGGKISAKKIEIVLEKNNLTEFLKSFLYDLQTHSNLQNAFFNTLSNFEKLSFESGLQQGKPVEISKLKENFNQSIDAILAQLNQNPLSESLTMSLTVDPWGKILSRKVELLSGKDKTVFESTDFLSSQEIRHQKIFFQHPIEIPFLGYKTPTLLYTERSQEDASLASESGVSNLTITLDDLKDPSIGIVHAINYVRSKDENSDIGLKTGNYKFNLELHAPFEEQNFTFSGEFDSKKSSVETSKGYDHRLKLATKNIVTQEAFSFTLNVSTKSIGDAEIPYPPMQVPQLFEVHSLDDSTFKKLQEDMESGFMQFLKSNVNLWNMQ